MPFHEISIPGNFVKLVFYAVLPDSNIRKFNHFTINVPYADVICQSQIFVYVICRSTDIIIVENGFESKLFDAICFNEWKVKLNE